MRSRNQFRPLGSSVALLVVVLGTNTNAQHNFGQGLQGTFTTGVNLNLSEDPEIGVLFNLRPIPRINGNAINTYFTAFTPFSDFGTDFELSLGGTALPIGGGGFGIATGLELSLEQDQTPEFKRTSFSIKPWVGPGVFQLRYAAALDFAIDVRPIDKYAFENSNEEVANESGVEGLEIGPSGSLMIGNNLHFGMAFRRHITFGMVKDVPSTTPDEPTATPTSWLSGYQLQLGTHVSFN